MGFPIRKSPDLSLFSGSPRLIAAYHVLHRLLTPRHPPYALSSLTINSHYDRCHQPFIHIQLSKNDSNPPSLPLRKRGQKGFIYLSYCGTTGQNMERSWRPNTPPATNLVEMSGFEPPTPCVQGRCSPAELHPHLQNSNFEIRISKLRFWWA
jgi:hypothetical protein